MLINLIIDLFSATKAEIPFILLAMLFSLVALLIVFPVHEMAHGLMAYWLGDKTAKYQGRLSLNPLDHLDLQGFLFLLLFGFGWAKPVQFDPRNFKNKRVGTILTAAAGPFANILFGFLSLLIYVVLVVTAESEGVLIFSNLFYYMAIYNVSLAVFNLIPFPPLDGSKIVGELLPLRTRIKYYELERYSFIFFLIVILLLNRINLLGSMTSTLLSWFMKPIGAIVGGLLG